MSVELPPKPEAEPKSLKINREGLQHTFDIEYGSYLLRGAGGGGGDTSYLGLAGDDFESRQDFDPEPLPSKDEQVTFLPGGYFARIEIRGNKQQPDPRTLLYKLETEDFKQLPPSVKHKLIIDLHRYDPKSGHDIQIGSDLYLGDDANLQKHKEQQFKKQMFEALEQARLAETIVLGKVDKDALLELPMSLPEPKEFIKKFDGTSVIIYPTIRYHWADWKLFQTERQQRWNNGGVKHLVQHALKEGQKISFEPREITYGGLTDSYIYLDWVLSQEEADTHNQMMADIIEDNKRRQSFYHRRAEMKQALKRCAALQKYQVLPWAYEYNHVQIHPDLLKKADGLVSEYKIKDVDVKAMKEDELDALLTQQAAVMAELQAMIAATGLSTEQLQRAEEGTVNKPQIPETVLSQVIDKLKEMHPLHYPIYDPRGAEQELRANGFYFGTKDDIKLAVDDEPAGPYKAWVQKVSGLGVSSTATEVDRVSFSAAQKPVGVLSILYGAKKDRDDNLSVFYAKWVDQTLIDREQQAKAKAQPAEPETMDDAMAALKARFGGKDKKPEQKKKGKK